MLGHTRQFMHPFRRSHTELSAHDVAAARAYIADYWQNLIRHNPKQDSTLIALPKPYVVPAHEDGREFDFPEMYYWDTFFIMQGLLDEKHKDLVLGMLENLTHMYERFRIIPNASTYLGPIASAFSLVIHPGRVPLFWYEPPVAQEAYSNR
jgi:alpha,alpha-trehalase